MSVPITGADFSLRPVFIGWIAFLVQLPFQLFFTRLERRLFWRDAGLLRPACTGVRHSSFSARCGFIAVPVVAYFGKKLNYARTEYNFFPDRLEFEEGFLQHQPQSDQVPRSSRGLTLRKGPLQRIYGLGTVYIATLATGTSSS